MGALVLVLAGCSAPTEPIHESLSEGDLSGAGAAFGLVNSTEAARSQEPWVSGAFRHNDLVITVHGVRLNPDLFVQATYDLDPESPWPMGWAEGMDFLTSVGGRLYEGSENTGAVAVLKATGEGFTFSVPLSAMHDPTGPITFAIIVCSCNGGYGTDLPDQGYYFRAFGRAECRQCTKVAGRP